MSNGSTQPLIEAQSLSRWFGEIMALNDLSLTIGEGVTGLLGPNGAGKSTFIKLALGHYHPSKGEVRVLGEPPRNNYRVLNRIAYCPETDHFYDNMSGYEFVYWLTRFSGTYAKEAKRAAAAACELLGMAGRMHDPIDTYSKGMRQRIKVAQALTSAAEILFLDEPMSGLDPAGREEMYALIQDIGAQRHHSELTRNLRAVVVSSHVLYEIERVTNNVVVLYNGSLLAYGRVREIRELIDKHPHTITVECEQPRALSPFLAPEAGIISVEFQSGGLTVRTRDPNRCYQVLNDAVLDTGINVKSITCADDNLQAVFEYLTK